MNHRIKTHSVFTQALASLCAALLIVAPVLPVRAVDIQTLPLDTKAATGFTHAALVTWDDLNATDNVITIVELGAIPTNSYIDRAAFYIEEPFTNTAAAGTNLTFTLGVANSTNRFFGTNYIDGSTIRTDNGTTLWMLSTNLLVPYKSTTSTNHVVATFSDQFDASLVDTYTKGRIRIYWRLVEPGRIRF